MLKGLSFIVLSYLLQSQVVAHFEFFSNFGILFLVPYTKDFGKITQF